MKFVELGDLDNLPGKRLGNDDVFCFRCHAGRSCFNRCCRNLNLFLYPYDVLRLKHALGISSDRFLERYVDVVLRPDNFFPEVLLKMSDDTQKSCPFLSAAGCTVYADRPGTCRSFPVEQGLRLDADGRHGKHINFFRPPEFCEGPQSRTRWTMRSWIRDQQAQTYQRMTIRWGALKGLFAQDPWGVQGPTGAKAKMAFMATYNLDPFREFVFHSTFLDRYRVPLKSLKKMQSDDVALLQLGLEWVKGFVWGMPSKMVRPRRF